MADTSIQADAPISQQVRPEQSVSEDEWLVKRREKRMQERAQERQAAEAAEPAEEPKQETEPEGDPDPAETEAEAEDVTRDAELLAEAVEPEGETEPAEGDAGDFPGTVSELAESLDFDPNDLAEHLQMTVNPNGETQDVTLAEMAKGYMREADYTRKTKALAEKERSFEATSKQALERQKASLEQLDAVAMVLAREIDMGPDDAEVARISREEPHRYPQVVEERNRKIQAYRQAQEARARVSQEAEVRNRDAMAAYRGEQQQKLGERLPDMKVPEKAKALEDTMRSFLTGPDIGFTNDEVTAFINGPFDHRQVLVIARAAQAAMQQKVEKKVQKKLKKLPKVGRSGARRQQAQKGSSELRSAKQKLRKDQSVEAGLEMLRARRKARRNATHGGSQ